MKIANYMTTGIRHLLNHKLFSAINIFGLAIGLMACILISLFVQDELSYDSGWNNSDRIYRMHTELRIPGQAAFSIPLAPGPVKHALAKDYPEIELVSRVRRFSPTMKIGSNAFVDSVKWVDPEFIDIFNFDILAGDLKATMGDASSLALSRKRAIKYFGSVEEALDGVITVNRGEIQRDFKVGAIFENLPHNTHLLIDAMAPVDEADFAEEPWHFASWWGTNTYLYFILKDGVTIDALQADIDGFTDRNYPLLPFGDIKKPSDQIHHSIINVGDIQLKSIGAQEMKPVGNINTVLTYSAVAILILIIASINFTNLSTARATQRAREVAVRKVLGANKKQLIVQFLGESVLVTLIALIIALAGVELLLPAYNEALNKTLTISYGAASILPLFTLLAIIVGVGGGIYPALIMSGFRPASVLKANKSAETSGTMKLRMMLVIFQFAVSIGLMVSTAVVYGQTLYAKTLDQGFNKDSLMLFEDFNRAGAFEKQQVILQELRNHPQVISATRSSATPGNVNNNNTSLHKPGDDSTENDLLLGSRDVDFNFFETYQTKMLAGRSYSMERGDMKPTMEDVIAGRAKGSMIINYTALSRLGFASAEEAVGQYMQLGRGAHEGKPVWAEMEIIGVSEDFNLESVHREVRPEVYFLEPSDQYRTMSARFTGDPIHLVTDMEKLFKATIPDVPISITFADEAMAMQYANEEAESTLFAVFSLLAIVVACLGLYGLASFTAERRTKEIGIRKVMGAEVFDIIKLLLWQFSIPVLIANIIAWPVSWYFMNDWLSQFVYRFDNIYIAAFCLIAGLLAMLIAWGTISFNALKVAKSNPINALRYE